MLFLPLFVPLAAPFMPKPANVPRNAAMTYDWKASGTYYHWARTLPHGCVKWDATRSHAYVTLSLGRPDCDGERDISYYTNGDDIVFRPGREPLFGGRPCPFTISASAKNELEQLVSDASAVAETDAERAVLRRVRQRISQADGSALLTDAGGGCNDAQPIDYHRPRKDRVDVWPRL
jgi:hypothetical protein